MAQQEIRPLGEIAKNLAFRPDPAIQQGGSMDAIFGHDEVPVEERPTQVLPAQESPDISERPTQIIPRIR